MSAAYMAALDAIHLASCQTRAPRPQESERKMPRQNRIKWKDGKVCVVLGNIQHSLTVPAFLELMQDAMPILQSIQRVHEVIDRMPTQTKDE